MGAAWERGHARRQLLIYSGLAAGVASLAAVAFAINERSLRHLAVVSQPLLIVFGSALGGLALLAAPLRAGGFVVAGPDSVVGLLRASVLAVLFGAVVIVADLSLVFPADMNVAFPESLLAYPAIALVVEVGFHLGPLSLVPRGVRTRSLVFAAVAMLEPAYQLLEPSARASGWRFGFVAIHVFVFNVAQLALFRRHGFICMYALRLLYYLVWHVAWGHLRLQILFS